MWEAEEEAPPEYATAKIAVWWDIKDCPVPEGYNAGLVRPSLQVAFKKLGYSGPVSITAFGDHTQTPKDVLRGLFSSGVSVAHTTTRCKWSRMYDDILEWRDSNPPPATMMLISDNAEDVLSWDLARLQQHTKYNLFRAFSFTSEFASVLVSSEEWLWGDLLLPSSDNIHETNNESSDAVLYCKSCSFDCQSLEKFTKHLSSRKHAVEEVIHPGYEQLDTVTRTWGKNYKASAEYATAPIAVWWDMNDCPVPDGYNATRVRPSMEAAFKSLGYSGPVSIYAYGDLSESSDRLLLDLSSTGVALAHTTPDVSVSRIYDDMIKWQQYNPPPATMMLISDDVEEGLADPLATEQQEKKYNFFLAYSFRPYKMSVLVTYAEWLWDSLLTVYETRIQVLHKCNERGESTTVMIYCNSCYCDCKGLDNFRKHLSSQDHALEESSVDESYRSSQRNQEYWRKVRAFPKSCKRLRKTSRTGFGPFHSHLHRAKNS